MQLIHWVDYEDRYQPVNVGRNAFGGFFSGLALALLFSAVAAVAYATEGPDLAARVGLQLGECIRFYITAMPLGGLVAGLLWHRTNSRIGSAAVGFVSVSPVFLGIVVLSQGAPLRWPLIAWLAYLFLCGLFGARLLGGNLYRTHHPDVDPNQPDGMS